MTLGIRSERHSAFRMGRGIRDKLAHARLQRDQRMYTYRPLRAKHKIHVSFAGKVRTVKRNSLAVVSFALAIKFIK